MKGPRNYTLQALETHDALIAVENFSETTLPSKTKT